MKFSREKLPGWGGVAALVCAGAFLAGCSSTGGAYKGSFSEPPPPTAAAVAPAVPAVPAIAPSIAETNKPGVRIRPGEALSITFSDVGTPIPPFAGRVKDDGKITLMQNMDFTAAGKTEAELEKEIRDRYVPRYFQNLTATVIVQDRYFCVLGEVRQSGRVAHSGRITLIGAIAAVGGFNEFAKATKIQIIRTNNQKEIVNYDQIKKNPDRDVEIYPGDRIIVPRRFW